MIADFDYGGFEFSDPTRPACNICFNCRWSKPVIGSSHHQSCTTRIAQQADTVLSALKVGLIGRMETGFTMVAMDRETDEEVSRQFIAANQHGFNQGWFMWPFDFDPVWLHECTGFEPKGPVDG